MKLISLSCVVMLLAAAAPAFAEPVVTAQRSQIDDGSVSRVVHFHDLDIATASGEKKLMQRVRHAVSYVCAPAGDFSTFASCQSYAWNAARPQISDALDLARTNPTLAMATLSALTISAPR